MEFITNLFSNDKVLSGLFANLDLIKLSYTFGGLLFTFTVAKLFYVNFGLIEKDSPIYKVVLFNLYLVAIGVCYGKCGELLPEQSQPNTDEKLFALVVLGIIVGISSWRKTNSINAYRRQFFANIWAPIKLTVLFTISVFTFGLFSFIMFEYTITALGMRKANHFYRLNSVLIAYCNMLSRTMVVIHMPLLEQTEEKGKLLFKQRLNDLLIVKEDSLGRPETLSEVIEAMDKRLAELKKTGKELDKKLDKVLVSIVKDEDSEDKS